MRELRNNKIKSRFGELRLSGYPKMEIYKILSREFYITERQVRAIVNGESNEG